MSDADLPSLAAFAVVALIGGYVVLDSFDLGAGMLLLNETDRTGRDAVVRSTAATRYSSEWWLIEAALMMYFAFPFPFRMLAEGLAAPIAVMLAALAARGVAAFLRRSAGDKAERRWSAVFAIASFVATAAQGFCLGGYLRGFSVAHGRFIGGWLDWATPFSVLIAAALTIGYALLGSAWVAFQADGALADQARKRMSSLAIAAAIAMAPLPIAAALGLAGAFLSPLMRKPHIGFFGSLVAIVAAYGGLTASVWPYVVPYGFTAAQSAADIHELRLSLFWVSLGAPVLFMFSVLSYDAWRVHLGRSRLLPFGISLRY
ncbi:MAG: cytochrome d ubiquinol oxidase subunit II [Hyphomonadaceae bacterium]